MNATPLTLDTQVLWETLTSDLSVDESMSAIGLDVVIAAVMRLVSHGVGDEVQVQTREYKTFRYQMGFTQFALSLAK